MASLSKNWIIEKHIDFEYKKYLLLAYLQSVNSSFEAYKLYPALADIIEHHKQLIKLKSGHTELFNSLKGDLIGIDKEKKQLVYNKIAHNQEVINELMSIIDFSLPQFESYLNEGKSLYDEVEELMEIFPIGVIPLNAMEGYLLLRNGSRDTKAFEYKITVFEKPDVIYRGIHMEYVQSFKSSITNTPENIKSILIENNQKLPNPATYIIETKTPLPLNETFLPVAKRSLVRYVSSSS